MSENKPLADLEVTVVEIREELDRLVISSNEFLSIPSLRSASDTRTPRHDNVTKVLHSNTTGVTCGVSTGVPITFGLVTVTTHRSYATLMSGTSNDVRKSNALPELD